MSLFPKPWGNYLLEGLAETTAPEAVSWWPQTLGWQITFIIVLIYLALSIYKKWRRYQLNRYRREALAWLASLNLPVTPKNEALWRQLPALVKKVATEGYYSQPIADLTGKAWEQWLDQQVSPATFTTEQQGKLAHLAYQQQLNLNEQQLKSLKAAVKLWITHHEGELC